MPDAGEMTLHEVFERVAGKVPEVRRVGTTHTLGWEPERTTMAHWQLDDGSICGSFAHQSIAESLIVAACVRLLPGHYWVRPQGVAHKSQEIHVFRRRWGGEDVVVAFGPTVAVAWLLAVEAARGGGANMAEITNQELAKYLTDYADSGECPREPSARIREAATRLSAPAGKWRRGEEGEVKPSVSALTDGAPPWVHVSLGADSATMSGDDAEVFALELTQAVRKVREAESEDAARKRAYLESRGPKPIWDTGATVNAGGEAPVPVVATTPAPACPCGSTADPEACVRAGCTRKGKP